MADLFDNPRAFAPFHDAHVGLSGIRAGGRRVAGTFRACVIEGGFDDPVSESGTDTARRTLTVLIPRTGPECWCDREPPQKSDSVTLEDGGRFKVKKVEAFGRDSYRLEVRQ